jgi:hypothetical protein
MLRQQNKCLMNSMQIMSRHAKMNETVRKRAVEASQQTGEDHVVEVSLHASTTIRSIMIA